jgi:hypothetical protein
MDASAWSEDFLRAQYVLHTWRWRRITKSFDVALRISASPDGADDDSVDAAPIDSYQNVSPDVINILQ